MASNVFTDVVPQLLAQGLMALRENAVTPRLVANKSSAIAGKRGSTLDVPIPSRMSASAVTPAAYAPNAQALTPDTVPVTLDHWYESPFDMDDDDYESVMDGVIPMQASEAIRSIINTVDQHLLGLHLYVQGTYGTMGTTPFGTPGVADATGIRKVLNKQLAPMDPRHVIMDPDAEAAALGLAEFNRMDFSGSVAAMTEGQLNRKLGINWWMNQNVPSFTTGTLAHSVLSPAHAAYVNGALSAGVTTMALDNNASGTLTGTIKIGDRFTFAGSTIQYVVTNATSASGNAVTGVTFYPAIPIGGIADNTVVTFNQTAAATGVANLAFHRDCIAFATRPLMPTPEGLGAVSLSAVDPISGLPLRLEVTREYKRTRWSFDLLWGANVVRPELGAVLWG